MPRWDEASRRTVTRATTASPTQPHGAAGLYRDAMRAAVVGIAVNLALGFVKLIGGIGGRSFALISDAVNSLGDALTSIVVLAGLWIAQRPADAEHPYGHTKAEGIAASNVALLIIVSALFVGWEAIRRMHLVHPLPPVWALWIAAGNVAIKEGLYRYKVRVGRRTGSASILANAWDHRGDALCSLAALVGIAVVRWAGPAYIAADEVAALAIVSIIVWTGTRLFRRSASELMDLQADEPLVAQIRQAANDVDGVKAVEKLWVRKSGLEYLADIHIEVDARITVEEGHRIGHCVKDRLVAGFPSLRDVLVHLEPYPHEHDN